MKRFLRGLNHYIVFFLMVAFLVTCCIMLFTQTLMGSLGIVLTGEDLGTAAKLTFINVILLSVLFTVFDTIRRKLTVERTAKRIAEAAKRIVAGDFSARVTRPSRFSNDEHFVEIIDCFNRMAEELSGVETLRTDFISTVSHEMKTPLAVMQNYGTLLQSPDLPEDKRIEYAKGITDSSRRLADMVTNILKLNKLENQQISPTQRSTIWASSCANPSCSTKTCGSGRTLTSKRTLPRTYRSALTGNCCRWCGTTFCPMPSSSLRQAARFP